MTGGARLLVTRFCEGVLPKAGDGQMGVQPEGARPPEAIDVAVMLCAPRDLRG